MNAIQIIQSEHRALAAVLHGLQYLVDEICLRGKPVDLRAVGAMIYYIDAFPERFHHPKEDRYLFPLLEARSPQCAAAIGALKAEHALGARKMRALEQAFTRYRDGGAAELPTFAAAVEAYCTFEREHISREEREILPLAKRVLTSGVKRVDVAELYDAEAYRPRVQHLIGKPMFLY